MLNPLPKLPDEPPPPPLSWYEIWKSAVAEPSVDTFIRIAWDLRLSPQRAYVWVTLGALLGSILAGVTGLIVGAVLNASASSPTGAGNPSPFALIVIAPAVALFTLASFIIGVNLLHLLAFRLGGRGALPRLVFAMGAFVAPLVLVGLILSAIPLVSATDLLLLLYGALLTVFAVRAVHQLNWARSALALGLMLLILMGLGACFGIAVAPLLLQAGG